MNKGQMRSIEAIFAVILVLIAYSKITQPIYQQSAPTRSLNFQADRILEVMDKTGLVKETIEGYDFSQLDFLASEITPIGYNHQISVTYYLPLRVNNTRNSTLSKVLLTRSIPRFVEVDSIQVSTKNYTISTCATENWKVIPLTIWSESNEVGKAVKIPYLWLNSSYRINLSSPTFYLRGEETKLNYTINFNTSFSNYNINLSIRAPRLKKGSNSGRLYYAFNKTLKNDNIVSFKGEKKGKCAERPEKTCYTKEAPRKASRYDIFFEPYIKNHTRKQFYLRYSYGVEEDRECKLEKSQFLNQSKVGLGMPEERLISSTKLSFKQPQTTTYSSSNFFSLGGKKAEVNLKIWSQFQ